MFSFPMMCVFLLSAVIFGYAPRGISIGEPDIWWRLRSAGDILATHRLTALDTYSFTAAGVPWINFEWASDLLFYASFKLMGLQGIVVLYSLAMVLIFAGVYYRSCRAGADCKDAAVATLGGISLGMVSLAPRPVLFGWVCLTGLLVILDRFRDTGRGLWLLPLLFAVWINLHGSWIYGMAVLTLTVAGGLVQGEWGSVVAQRWSPTELRNLLIAFCASIAALFINPFGYKLVMFPVKFWQMRDFMQYVEYWQPVDFGTWNGKLALGLIFALLAAGVLSQRRWRLDEVLLIGIALFFGLSHVRFLDFTAIIVVPILAPRLKLFPPYEPELDKPLLNAAIMIGLVAAVVFLFPSAKSLQRTVDAEYPTAALDYMRLHNISERVFSPNEFGCFIDWYAPGIQTFTDGREVFVERGIYQDSMQVILVRRPFETLDKYRIKYILTKPNQALEYLLQHSNDWRLIYSDNVAVLFERTAATPS